MKYQTILLAAGNSSRSSLPYNKVLHLIENKPIIYLSFATKLRVFLSKWVGSNDKRSPLNN